MGVSKTEIFTEEQNKIAVRAKALGHPASVAILQHLFNTSSCICGNWSIIGLAQPTISQHLKGLKNLGLIKENISCISVCYFIDEKRWASMKTTLLTLLDQNSSTSASCC